MVASIALVIPARYDSKRLPGKPLVNIAGQSMLQRTWLRCCKAVPAETVWIATDDERIKSHCTSFGAQVVMTPGSCLTGTDRVYEASKEIDADVFINVQGDEPLVNPEDISRIVETAQHKPDQVINGYAEINDACEWRRSSIPKVVVAPDGRLIYMSRAAIPANKELSFTKAWKQICIYAFPRAALRAFATCENKTPIESIEDIEVLRFLELGMDVFMVALSGQSMAVDTSEDLEKVRRLLHAPID